MATEGLAFGAMLRRLRLAAGLTQERLAERAGVSAKAIIALENDPARTPRRETVTRLADALGLNREDRERLLAAARPESLAVVGPGPTERAETEPIGPGLGSAELEPTSLEARTAEPEPIPRSPLVPPAHRGEDWGEAPDVAELHGRALELATLGRWVGADGCRLVAIVGMGGIGKTSLAARLARELAAGFDALYWRSLRNAPLCPDWLGGAIGLVSGHQVLPAPDEEARLRQLLELLRARRSLVVLDNFETVLEPGAPEVGYRAGYEGYGQLLQWLGEAGHRSCLLVTSREVPPEIGPKAGAQGTVRALRLGGIETTAGRALLADRALVGDAAACEALVTRYGGNPLALRVVSETIDELFGGQIATFLAQEGTVFGDIRRLLDAHVERLSAAERTVLDWLAVEREPVVFSTLVRDLGPALRRGEALEALEALRRRSLLEQGEEGATVTLQPVVLEYATERLVEQLAEGISDGRLARLMSHGVVKAQAKEYVRRSQERLIAGPILARLSARHDRSGTEQRLLALLDGWRDRRPEEHGYGPGNVVNLLRLLRGDLRGLDLSRLAIRQAYLAEVEAQDARLVDAQLADVVLAEAFDYPTSVALSANGVHLAVGTATGQLYLWRFADRTLLLSVQGHSSGVHGLALSTDGRLMASGSEDGTVKLWETGSGQLRATLRGHAGGVPDVALSADGGLVASGGMDGTVRLWAAASGRLLATLEGHTDLVRGVALSGDGGLVASAGDDGTVRLWAAASGRLLATLEGHTGLVRGVALSGDGGLVASAGDDGTVRLWAAASGRLLVTLEGHTGPVYRVALSADGRLVASGSHDGTVRLWDAPSGRPVVTLEGYTAGVRGAALSGDGRLVASGSHDGTVRLWDAPSGRPVVTLEGYTAGVRSAALSGDGRLVASGSHDGTVRLWDAPSGQLAANLHGHSSGVWSVALSADGRLVASSSEDGTIKLWEAGSGRLLTTLQGHASAVWSVALSANGGLVASGSEDGTVKLWDVSTGQLAATSHGHSSAVWSVALSGDGRLVASGGDDGTVRLWAAPVTRLLAILEGHTGPVYGVALSADGRLLASGSFDGTVRLWAAPGGRLLATLEGHSGLIQGVALSADGRLVASGGFDRTVRLWEAASGRLLATLEGHTGPVFGVALSADGGLVASGGFDGTVRLWAAPGGTSLRTLRADRRYERLDITGLTGITEAQRQALLALGAVDRSAR